MLGLSEFWDTKFAEDLDLECLTRWKIMEHISSRLKFIHDNDTIHQDLKPSNGSFKFLDESTGLSLVIFERQVLEALRFWN